MMWFLMWSVAGAGDLDLHPHHVYVPESDESRIESPYVQTRERDVIIGGVKFHQIEVDGKVFQVRTMTPESFSNCTRFDLPNDYYTAEASVRVARRTRVFIEGLKAHCDEKIHAVLVDPAVDGNIGVKFEPSKPGGSEKKIMVNPFKRSTTFQSTF